jgi:hypothetical protein
LPTRCGPGLPAAARRFGTRHWTERAGNTEGGEEERGNEPQGMAEAGSLGKKSDGRWPRAIALSRICCRRRVPFG